MADRWYRDGLRFECTRCGECCTGDSGYVWVTLAESERIARHLGVSPEDFRRRHVRRVGNRYSLLERPNGDCILRNPDGGCTVYKVRPSQCRSFPFWPENIRSRKAWDALRDECPGVGCGRLYRVGEIERIRRGERDT